MVTCSEKESDKLHCCKFAKGQVPGIGYCDVPEGWESEGFITRWRAIGLPHSRAHFILPTGLCNQILGFKRKYPEPCLPPISLLPPLYAFFLMGNSPALPVPCANQASHINQGKSPSSWCRSCTQDRAGGCLECQCHWQGNAS